MVAGGGRLRQGKRQKVKGKREEAKRWRAVGGGCGNEAECLDRSNTQPKNHEKLYLQAGQGLYRSDLDLTLRLWPTICTKHRIFDIAERTSAMCGRRNCSAFLPVFISRDSCLTVIYRLFANVGRAAGVRASRPIAPFVCASTHAGSAECAVGHIL